MDQNLVNELRQNYEVVFRDMALLDQAFTHSSYANEHRYLKLVDNERLEFLGDAVLELAVSNFLYRLFPKMPEGKLTKLRAAIVCEDSLSKLAVECHFDLYIQLGKGEENSNGRKRPALLCDLFEAFLGALYLDQGMKVAVDFLKKVLFPKIADGAFSHEMDHKTRLQEILQRKGDVVIDYVLVKEEGPSHSRQFEVEVFAAGQCIGSGVGRSKKAAEQEAAGAALRTMNQV